MKKSNCCEKNNNKIIVVEENRSRMVIKNELKVDVVICQIDGCIIDDNTQRCDKLVRFEDKKTLLVELKGKDIEKAASQLESTLKNDKIKNELKGRISAIVICSRVRIPGFSGFILKTKSHFRRHYKSEFHVKTTGCSVSHDDLFSN